MESQVNGRDRQHSPRPDVEAYVRVFERDPALLEGTDGATAAFLREHGTVPAVRVEPGPWHPPSHRASTRHWLGLLVLDGLLMRPLTIGRRRVHELLGPGDLLRPWDHERWEGVRSHSPWAVLTPVALGLLDEGFTAVAGKNHSVLNALVSRALRRSAHVGAAVAIQDQDEPHLRVWGLLAHAADRWGRPGEQGMVLPAGLTLRAIAVAVGVDEASAGDALERLGREGAVEHDADGAIVFRG
jgi:hypothetical protein